MSDTPGLFVQLQVPLSKYEKQFARAEAVAEKRANNIVRKFNEANRRGAQSLTKSAAASAQVFEKAIDKETRAFQQLKASVDPAYAAQRRYEAAVRQVQAAVRMGAVSQKDANAVLELARAKNLGAAGAASTYAAAAGGVFKVSNAGRFVLQNTTNQVADMAVQFEMGTNPLRIMGQQLPQVFGGFGALGGVLGTVAPLLGVVAAIGFPVAAFLLNAGKNAEDSADKIKDFADAWDKAEAAINRANAAVSRAVSGDLEAMRDAYGEVSAEVQNLIETLARLELEKARLATNASVDQFFTENTEVTDLLTAVDNRARTIRSLEAQIDALSVKAESNNSRAAGRARIALEGVRQALEGVETIDDISDQFNVDPSAIASIHDARDALQEARDSGDMDAMVESIARLRAVLASIPDGPLADMGDELALAEDILRRALAQSERLKTSAGGISFDGAAASASRMAEEISRAVDAMHNLRAQGQKDLKTAKIKYQYRDDPVGRAGALAGAEFDSQTAPLRDAGFDNLGEEAYYNQQRQARIDDAKEIARLNEASRPTRKSSSGRSGSSSKDFDLFANSEKEITALERQIEMVGKSRREVVALTAKYDLLDAAKEKGINLDQVSTQTGRTLREEIDAHADSIAGLTIKAEQYAARAEFMANINQDLKDGLVDAIVEGKNFGDVLADVAKQLEKAAVQAALFGEGPLSGLFGGGSGILGAAAGALGIPGFASGTQSAPGGLAMVGEDGPELVNLPRGAQVIPNHKLGQVGGQSQVDVYIHPSGEFDARVQQISGNVAVSVSGQMISRNNRQVSQMQRR